ncbi:MAG TPA: SRPBCC family protein [Gammaproteobacteria bacterium]|jgi:hypothetical protein
MSKVRVSATFNVSADELWKLVGNFQGLGNWIPTIKRSESEGGTISSGATRKLALAGGGELIERLEHVSDSERVYRYSIVSGPLPVADYEAEVRVRDRGNGSATVEWSSKFEPKDVQEADAVQAVQDLYNAGFENLRRLYGG